MTGRAKADDWSFQLCADNEALRRFARTVGAKENVDALRFHFSHRRSIFCNIGSNIARQVDVLNGLKRFMSVHFFKQIEVVLMQANPMIDSGFR